MGIEIDTTEFSDADHRRFAHRLGEQLETLRELLARDDFGLGPATIGSELELYLVDGQGLPLSCNQEIQAALGDPQLTLELNRYNLEYNLSPYGLGEEGLLATEREINASLATLRTAAGEFDARVVPIGILPTLRPEDFGRHRVTDLRRFHALVARLIDARGSDFHIDINGAEPLQLGMTDITLEGANTSFQVHLRVEPEHYATTFNALQLTTPLVVAICANSPGLFRHDLWDETRIPLFKQSIDTRHTDRYRWSEPARVSFGHGWVRECASELFEEAVRLYPPLLPACDEKPSEGPVPRLSELRLHQGTVWQWNRAIYDDAGDGHLRMEARALPAGPTAIDMVAGAALTLGLARGLRDRIARLLPALPFPLAEYNFYRAAQNGLDARLVWPSEKQHGLQELPLVEVLADLLPVADEGLRALGVTQAERDRYLGVIDTRLSTGRNPAAWQRQATRRALDSGCDKREALASMLERYIALSESNEAVAEWPL